MRSKLYFIIVFLVTLAFAVFTQSDFPRFLLGFEFLLELALLVSARLMNYFVDKTMCPPPSEVSKSQEIPVDISLKNRSSLPVSEIKVFLKCRDEYSGSEDRIRGTAMLSEKDKTIFRFVLNTRHYGLIRVWAERIRISDPLGINFAVSRFPKQMWEIAVLPEAALPETYHSSQSTAERLDEDGVSSFRKGNDIGETYELRAYQSGEPLRNIHWKMTAKTGDFIVKEFGKETVKMGLVFLDLNDYGKAYSRSDWDFFIETVASYAAAQVRSGNQFEMFWLDEQTQRCSAQIHNERDVKNALTALLHYKPHSGSDGEIAYKEKLTDETYDAPVCIDLWGKISEEKTAC